MHAPIPRADVWMKPAVEPADMRRKVKAMSEKIMQMRQSMALLFLGVVFLVGCVFGFLVPAWAGQRVFGGNKLVPMFVARGPALQNDSTAARGFASVFKPALPAVVSIVSSRVVKVPQMPFFSDPFFQQFFGGQFPNRPQRQRERGLGSGVIVSPDGYILTNNHVIDKATDIKVILADKRRLNGKVVGADPKTGKEYKMMEMTYRKQ